MRDINSLMRMMTLSSVMPLLSKGGRFLSPFGLSPIEPIGPARTSRPPKVSHRDARGRRWTKNRSQIERSNRRKAKAKAAYARARA